jgi:short-subunit dehydrogenase
MADYDFTGKVVVITGATSGFGRGGALAFAQAGASVVLAARRDELLDDLVRECMSYGSRALAVPTDVSIQQDVERLAQAAVSEFGRIDVWINNAGVGALGRFEEVPLTDHVQVIEVNLLGVVYGSYFAMLQFRQQQSGILINVASVLGKIPSPYYASYTASKYGVVGLSAVLRQELRENNVEGIHVCTVMPMAHDTPWFEHAANYTGHEAQPLPPVYDPQQVVDTFIRLAANPEDEVIVGTAGKVMTAAHGIVPGVVEMAMAKEAQMVQQNAPHAPATEGSLHEPRTTGAQIYGGHLEK